MLLHPESGAATEGKVWGFPVLFCYDKNNSISCLKRCDLEVGSAKMCSFLIKAHSYEKSLTLLQKSCKYLDGLLIQWQNARYLFKFPALLKPSGICTSHLTTGLHHWSVKWTSLTSHSVTVNGFMQLSLSIMQFTELPNIQENQCSLRLEMAGEYSFDHSEPELFKLIPCSFWPL